MNALAQMASAPLQCRQCASVVPEARRQLGPFCCDGCRTVFDMMRDAGMASPTVTRMVPPQKLEGFAAFDDPRFIADNAMQLADGRIAVSLVLEGIHCASCLWLLERLPRILPGVLSARLDMARAALFVTYDSERVRMSEIAVMLARLGYPPHPDRGAARDALRRREDRALLMRLGVAAACAGNVMMLAIALYAGDASGMDAGIRSYLRWASLLVSLPVIVYSADVFFRGAWLAIKSRSPHIDIALTLSLAAGFIQGVVNTIRDSGAIYFDSVVALVFALLASRYVYRRKLREAMDATEIIQALTPAITHRCNGEEVEDVLSSTLSEGDIVEVRAGEAFPADGRVVDGISDVNVALLTGESIPSAARVGVSVYAGTTNISATLRVRLAATGDSTRVAKLMRSAQSASATRPAVVRLADRLSVAFVIVALCLAVITVALAWSHDHADAIDRALALLIVACPCALGLATPLALTSAVGQAASRRMLIKGGDELERLASARTVVFDKTGTLTCGTMTLAHWFGERGVRDLVGALERSSTHPIGLALNAALGGSTLDVSARAEHPGGGVRGIVRGHFMAVGNEAFVREQATLAWQWSEAAEDLAESGITPVFVACDGHVVAIAGLVDAIRDDARDAVARLARQGMNIHLLSGDNPRVVARVARELGIACYEGGASPERKLEVVRALRDAGPVIMVGDGVNDAAALAAASVGVAVQGGAEASLAVADIYVDQPRVGAIADLVRGARRALATVHICFACGLVYNIVGVSLAMSGIVTPLIAAILMPASSLTVVTLAYRRRAFGGRS